MVVATVVGCGFPQGGDHSRTLQVGYTSVSEMLSRPTFYSVHRGGSDTEPEMTMEAYERSAERGFGMLEVSLARTSDGVWFGLHDETLDRTSGVEGLPPVSEMTWADVARYQVTLNDGGSPQPYMSWTEFVSAFAHTHVVLVDPKYASGSGHLDDFLDMVQRDVGTDRAVIKAYGSDTRLADRARERGFTTWGYYYESDVTDGTLDRTQDHWSLLGMNWDASAEAWAAVTGYGKPVIAHVIESDEQRDIAKAKGARGFQVSNIDAVQPD